MRSLDPSVEGNGCPNLLFLDHCRSLTQKKKNQLELNWC